MKTPHARPHQRIDLEITVDLESEHSFYSGLARNIGAGGVFIATHHLRRIGERINLRFWLPGSAKEVTVETDVRWIRQNTGIPHDGLQTGMGLRFIDLNADAATAIERFLEKRDSLYCDDE